MNRRQFVAAGMALPLTARLGRATGSDGSTQTVPPDHPLQASWQAWKTLCLAPEGRVIDNFQENASHSEGQGYGLVLAALFGDAEAAGRIIRWTEDNLTLREDNLLAWRWLPDAMPHVADRNNASDGDLFYAWGLLLSAPLADGPARRERAARIGNDLARRCVVTAPDGSGQPVLLPGTRGFQTAEGLVVNPSYYMARALRDLALASSQPLLAQLADSGSQLIERLAAKGPVPDWVLLTEHGPEPAPSPFSGVSGYEAVRVPLFALWSDAGQSAVVQGYAKRMLEAGEEGGTPTVFEPSGRGIFERSPNPGYAALAALAHCASAGEVGSLMPAFTADQPYYPATLHLMALVIQVTTYPRCVPI